MLSFNSMKVRLKLVTDNVHNATVLFQFHEGPIKTLLSAISRNLLPGFNSMKVRLKHGDTKLRCTTTHTFQFHEGPIKTFPRKSW